MNRLTMAESISFDAAKTLPATPAVYWVVKGEQVLYVGQTVNLQQRMQAHHRILNMRQREADQIRWIAVERDDLLAIEKDLIRQFAPLLNGRGGTVSVTSSGLIKTSFGIERDQLARIDQICRERHMTRGVFIRLAIDEWLERDKQLIPRLVPQNTERAS